MRAVALTTIALATLAAPGRPDAARLDCEAPAIEIRLGQEVRGTIRATDRPYPANATYYCVAVPADTRELTMTLSGMSVDLDLYVAFGTIRTLQSADLETGEPYDWKSNEFGTVTERVVIASPRAGTYYIEIVSYESLGSNFTFVVRGG